ncbi:hypothetical protein O7632_24160 [Solwaraspora sp. WMMD406]|uniref:hypothetical protein n=1 Tax=Solwaraspora sp. WMMD406 TaxID=3016095 RepID=UPI00241596EF|nr:hypothetical protein [Solwaraspora sp. WMMD406]MDG4767168.1 hypothetical protein [Solwaraspora sp. WMMD406]
MPPQVTVPVEQERLRMFGAGRRRPPQRRPDDLLLADRGEGVDRRCALLVPPPAGTIPPGEPEPAIPAGDKTYGRWAAPTLSRTATAPTVRMIVVPGESDRTPASAPLPR